MSKSALAGLKVLELGGGVSAAYTARPMADFGADVIKVEPPAGDITRRWGPFPGDDPDPEKSGLFFFLNTGKRSVVLELDADRDRLLELAGSADLVIENTPSGLLAGLGLDHDPMAANNPGLVTVSVSPFGRSGPYAGWKGTDLNAYHLSASGSRYCGAPDAAPLEHGTFAADIYGAVAGAAWGLAAVYGRRSVGSGQQVDVSSAEAIAATFVGGQNIGGYAQDGVFERRTGIGMPLGAPATIMPCKDGHVWMLALEPGQWNGLARVMGNPDWMGLEMFQDMFTRAQNSDAIYPLLEEWTLAHGKTEIMERCQAEGVPVTAVFTVAEAADHEHLAARGYIVEVEHPRLGKVRTLGAPFKLPASPGGPAGPAPLLGQHDGQSFHETGAATTTGRTAAGPRALPLEGIRVANFGWVWAGPVTGQTLSFLGAEVLKIESHARVDLTRTLPPFGGGERGPDRSLSNHACWAGNGSVTLNLKKPEALELAKRLVAECDVVVENFGPGVMDQLGLGYEELVKVRPDLVMFSMPAAGLYGPLKDVRTYGLSLTSTTGLDSLTGYTDGPPIPMENAFSDPFNGIFGAFAILAALSHRDRSGEGQHVDYSQQEAVMQMVGPAFMDHAMNGRVAGPIGNRHPLAAMAPHGVFPAAGEDRWIAIAVEDDEQWQLLVDEMGAPNWASDPALEQAVGRLAGIEAMHTELAGWTAGHDDHELAERLQALGLPATPVLNVADLLDDPHYKARGTFVEVDHPLGFKETIYGPYVKLSRGSYEPVPGPVMGQDNERIFTGLLGLEFERYHELVTDEVIY